MNRYLPFLLFIVAMTATNNLAAIDTGSEWEVPEQRELFEQLIHEVRCLVCQNQVIADSNAPLAADLRREIRKLVLAGNTEREIEDFLLERYGDFVLYRPRFKLETALLWLAPGLFLLGGSVVLWRTLRRRATLPVGSDDDEPMNNHEND